MVLELLTITFNIWPGGDCQLRKHKRGEGRKKERKKIKRKYHRVGLATEKERRNDSVAQTETN
jgi:hypothetical protein